MTNFNQHALLIGATGLVGRTLLELLSEDSNFDQITVLVRQLDAAFEHLPHVQQIEVTDFMKLQASDFVGYSHVFSCLGTTIAKAGSQEAFYAVDYGINAHVADCIQYVQQAASEQQGVHLLLISALGANAKSRIFYNRVKGELEDYIQNLNLARVSIFRPSLLLGERQEQRLLEQAGQKVFKFASSLLPKNFKHKPVTAEYVARAMLNAAHSQIEKFEIYDNLSIQRNLT